MKSWFEKIKIHMLTLTKKINNKFKIGDHVRISKYKSIFAKGYTSDPSE